MAYVEVTKKRAQSRLGYVNDRIGARGRGAHEALVAAPQDGRGSQPTPIPSR